jgi:hypothetical protein
LKYSKIFENRKIKAAAIIFIAAVCILTLYLLNPAEYTYYPTCYLYLLTGKLCPGCGGMRGMHLLLHGNIIGALKFNLLLAAVVPVGTYYLLSEFSVLLLGKPFPHLPHSKAVFYPVLFIVVLYWILRNL